MLSKTISYKLKMLIFDLDLPPPPILSLTRFVLTRLNPCMTPPKKGHIFKYIQNTADLNVAAHSYILLKSLHYIL